MENKKRLIDANALIEEANAEGAYGYVDAKQIADAPTVYAVEVVRCRECKHFRNYGKTSLFINGKNIKAGWCQRRIRYDEEYRMTADDFCSYGERKDGDWNG